MSTSAKAAAPRLLLATNNRGKVTEYRSLFQGLPYQLVTMAEAGITASVEEVGGGYEDNARLKATQMASKSGLLTVADDSGLEVDALGGEPGPRSARYAGEAASDVQRINFLLAKLTDVPREKRTARFRCVIAIAAPDGFVATVSGECPGIIAFEPQGELGFGYDPVFYILQVGKTMAELPLDIKNQVSHRGLAAQKARVILERLWKERYQGKA